VPNVEKPTQHPHPASTASANPLRPALPLPRQLSVQLAPPELQAPGPPPLLAPWSRAAALADKSIDSDGIRDIRLVPRALAAFFQTTTAHPSRMKSGTRTQRSRTRCRDPIMARATVPAVATSWHRERRLADINSPLHPAQTRRVRSSSNNSR